MVKIILLKTGGMMKTKCIFVVALLSMIGSFLLSACQVAQEPDYVVVDFFKGTAYERGFQHGERHATRIKSLYTRLLTNSIVPYLNREQVNIAPVLPVYQKPEFDNGQFSYLMLLRSGQYLIEQGYIADEFVCEMRGIADGSGMDFKEILILNTFFDTMMGFRSVVLFIQGIQEPYITNLSFGDALASDEFDNNANGEIDEEGEGFIEQYKTEPHATMLEVPADSSITMLIKDPQLLGLACIDLHNTTPVGCDLIDIRCVDVAHCIQDEYKDLEFVSREHFNENGHECLFPRIHFECFDIACIQSSDPGCVNPDSVRIQMDETLYVVDPESDAIQTRLIPPEDDGKDDEEDAEPELTCPLDGSGNLEECKEICGMDCTLECPPEPTCKGTLEITFKPPEGFDEASIVSLVLQVGDQAPIYTPEPYHNRFMRDERIVFTTEGYFDKLGIGDKLYDVENIGPFDGRNQPTSLAFAARGSATPDGEPVMAHHFALLDNDMLHEHSALFVQIPEEEDEGCEKECWLDIEVFDSCDIPDGCEDSKYIDHENLCKDNEENEVSGKMMYSSNGSGKMKAAKKRLPHAYVTYTGIVWGFSGMNSEGLTFGYTISDSFDNPLVGTAIGTIFELDKECQYTGLWNLVENQDLVGLSKVLKDAELKASGIPIGFTGRRILAESSNVEEGLAVLDDIAQNQGQTYGWNIMLADAEGNMAVAEVDGGALIAKRPADLPDDSKCALENSYIDDAAGIQRVFAYTPDDSDEANINPVTGKLYASVGTDDIRMASHFEKNVPDLLSNDKYILLDLMGIFAPRQQKYWTGFYLRSLRTFYRLGEEIDERYGQIGREGAIEILREKELIDSRDSMNSCVYQPSKKTINYGLGVLPASSAEFVEFNLVEELKERGLDK